MAFSKNKWMERIRDLFLTGALREYAKIVISKEIGEKDYWSNDVKGILSYIPVYMSDKVLLSRKFDREKMLAEAMREASTFQDQLLSAKNELMKHFPRIWKEIKLLNLDSEKVFAEMIDEFLPEYSHLLKR